MAQSQILGTEELKQKFGALDDDVKGENLVLATQAGSLLLRNAVVKKIKENGLIETRGLSRSVHSEVVLQTPTRAEVDTGTDAPYAAIHEYGGVIRAKKGKYLAIPVGTYKGGPRDHADLQPRKTSSGGMVLIDGSGAVQYVLKESVIIPARPYMRPACDETERDVQDEIARVLTKLIEKAAGA